MSLTIFQLYGSFLNRFSTVDCVIPILKNSSWSFQRAKTYKCPGIFLYSGLTLKNFSL